MPETATRVEPAQAAEPKWPSASASGGSAQCTGAAREYPFFLYRAADEPKVVWGVPEAGHVGAQEARPREYEQRVTRFFDRYLRREQR